MENLNKIDQFFKEENKKLEENISFPDFENVWEKIENRLDKTENKKKNIFVWLPYSLVASLVITVGLVYFFNQKSENIEISIASSNTNQKAINQRNNQSINPIESTKIDQSIQASLKESINKNKLISKNHLSNEVELVETAQPTAMASTFFNINNGNINALSVAKMDMKTESDSTIFLAANALEDKEVERNSASKEMKAKVYAQNITQENLYHTAEVTNDNLRTEQNHFEVAKITINKKSQPLYIIDGYVADSLFIKNYNMKKVTSLNIIEGESALQLYGNYGKKGVVVITTKGLNTKELKYLKKNKIDFSSRKFE